MENLSVPDFDLICQSLNIIGNERGAVTKEQAEKLAEYALKHAD